MEAFKEFKPILKFVVPFLAAVGSVVLSAYTDGEVTPDEWKLIAGAFATAVGVYLVPNKSTAEVPTETPKPELPK